MRAARSGVAWLFSAAVMASGWGAMASPPASASASVTSLRPGEAVPLRYWPFGPERVFDGMPGLAPVVLDVKLSARGCGDAGWSEVPLPGAHGPGPWCVAVARSGERGLLVLGRAGEAVVVLVPMVVSVSAAGVDGSEASVQRSHPVAVGPALRDAIAAWAAAPGGE